MDIHIIEQKLLTHLYRIACPTPDILGEYHFQLLTDDEVLEINQHLLICPYCPKELDQLQRYISDLEPELAYSLPERVKIWIAQLMPESEAGGFGSATPAFALRGETEEPYMFEAGNYQLTLEIQDDPVNPGFRSILGLVFGGSDGLEKVELWQDGEPVQATSIDELGNFVFHGVRSGTYDLILSQLAAEIHVHAFTV